jgi:hypothetical protein
MKRLLVPFLLWFLFFQGVANAEDQPLKVLFIGNSYTRVNDLPSMIVGLAEAAGGRRIETDEHLPGGRTLEKHLSEKKAIEKIRQKKWDVVVLQEQSLRPIIDRDRMFQDARLFHEEVKKQGARTVFYLTWARQNVPEMQEGADPATSQSYARAMHEMMCLGLKRSVDSVDFEAWCRQNKTGLARGLNGAYFDIARELHAELAPVGVAWKTALAADKNLVLHRSDKSHPNPTGTYLAACVFYATLLGKSPVGLPGEIQKDGKVLVQIPSEEAKRLQEIAWQTVQEAKAAP